MRRRQSRRRDVIEKNDDAADSSEKSDERVFHYKKGPCSKGACHEDPNVGCKVFENNTHACVCTHDSLPPTRKGDCPRKTVPIVAGRIPNVQPPLNSISLPTSNSTLASVQQPSTTQSAHTSTLIYFSILPVGVIIFVVVVLLITRWKKRKQMIQEQASPINLKHSLLIAERYAPNPQYSACPGAGVPILRKETLKFLNEIGEGCFGKVYKGEMTVEDSNKTETVAIKVLKKSASSEAEENFLREVEIMSTFKHQYILSLLGVVLRTDAATAPMMVFEYMPHGDLAEVLRSQRSPGGAPKTGIALQLPRKDLLSVALQVASGMRYLAAQRFVHRDLACRNCLVADGPTVKIADFGMSRDVYTCDYYKIGGSRLLPVRWMSPESVLYGRFTLESDIWSYGVVLWEIYSLGKQPYYGHTNEEVVKLILDGIMLIPPDDCPSLICELMKHCWKTEPRDRIKFPSICDKLELAYENALESGEDGSYVESTDAKASQVLKYENEFKQKVANLNKSLPRPPPIHLFKEEEEEEEKECDLQGYLIPKTIEKVQYLETMPD